jgi:hypothetical protein
MKTIKVKIKSVYGNETIYPLCDAGKTFAKIANTRTLTRETVEFIKQLGYSFEVCSPAFL